MKIISGVLTVLTTLFNSREEIDLDEMNKLIEILISGNVNGITLFGIGGEFYKLSENEKAHMLKNFIKTVNKRVTTIVSVTDHSAKNACLKAKEAQEAGADCLMILPPFFAGPDVYSVCDHIFKVLSSVDIPAIIQYAPQETNLVIPDEVFYRLSEEFGDRIYFKIESNDPGHFITELVKKGINKIFIGSGGISFYETLERGAVGVMPGCSLFDFFVSIYSNYIEGKKEISFNLHNKILPYLMFCGGSNEKFLSSEKYFLKLRGWIKNDYTRAPFYRLDPTDINILNKYKEIYFTNSAYNMS